MPEGRRIYTLPHYGYSLHVYPSLWTLHNCGFLDTALLLRFLRHHLEAWCPTCRGVEAVDEQEPDESLAPSRSLQLAELKRLRQRHALPSIPRAKALIRSLEDEGALGEESLALLDLLVDGFSFTPGYHPTATLACRALTLRAEAERIAGRPSRARSDLARGTEFLEHFRRLPGAHGPSVAPALAAPFTQTLGRLLLSEDRADEAGALLLYSALLDRVSGVEPSCLEELEAFDLPYPKALCFLQRG